jgi:hypothetical protein
MQWFRQKSGSDSAVSFEFVIAGRQIPVVPFHTNVYMPPLPTPKRCAALGREIARIIGLEDID